MFNVVYILFAVAVLRKKGSVIQTFLRSTFTKIYVSTQCIMFMKTRANEIGAKYNRNHLILPWCISVFLPIANCSLEKFPYINSFFLKVLNCFA